MTRIEAGDYIAATARKIAGHDKKIAKDPDQLTSFADYQPRINDLLATFSALDICSLIQQFTGAQGWRRAAQAFALVMFTAMIGL